MADIEKVVLIDPDTEAHAAITPAGAVLVTLNGEDVDVTPIIGALVPGNSTTTLLGAGGVFTGTVFDLTDYVTVNINAYSNVASAANGLSLQFSQDGTNWDVVENHTVAAGVGYTHLVRGKAQYCRVVYTNGATPQSAFRLAMVVKKTAVSMTFENLAIALNDTYDAALVRAVLAAKKPNGDYVNIQATTAGNLKVSIEEQDGAANLAKETGGNLDNLVGLEIPAHDYIGLSYTGANMTGVVYKTGGSGGTTVATLTLVYDGSNNLTSVTKS